MHWVIINLTKPLPKEVQHLPVKALKEPKRKVSDGGYWVICDVIAGAWG